MDEVLLPDDRFTKFLAARRRRWRVLEFVLIPLVLIFLGLFLLSRRESEFSLIRGQKPLSPPVLLSRGARIVSEEQNFVLRSNFWEAVRKARREFVVPLGWQEHIMNMDGSWGGGPFADFIGPNGQSMRIIRGDRTLPYEARKSIAEPDRKNWVVVTVQRPVSTGAWAWLKILARRVFGGP